MEIYNRIIDLPKLLKSKSVFLLGPRQTGKTTLIRQQLPTATVVDLLKSEVFLQYQRQPQTIRTLALESKSIVVVDEIQRVPEILNEVHYLIEEKDIRFLLTGSSARKLRKQGVNLLGGRARNHALFPLTSYELGVDFSLAKALHRGTLPSLYLSDDSQLDLSAYVENYLRLEIASEALTRNIPAFSRFLEVAALSNGKVINYAKIANDSQIAPSTAQEYFTILQDTLMGTSLPAWKEGIKRKPSTTAKFYFFDVGVVNAILQRWNISPHSSDFGELLEAFIFNELNAFTNYNRLSPLSHWRSLQRDEVDFIFDNRIAIEVKAKKQISKKELRGLKKLQEEKAHDRFLLVCQALSKEKRNDIEIWPVTEFLRALWDGEFTK